MSKIWTTALLVPISGGVMYGYIAEIDLLKSIDNSWVTMKFGTAFLLLVCCLSMWAARAHSLIAGILLTTCFYYLTSYLLGYHVGFFPVFDEREAVQTIREGLPCWATLINFSLFAFYLIFRNRLFLYLVAAIAGVVFLGYLLQLPVLYFSVEWSTSMALHTAIGFLHISTYRVEKK